MTNYFALHTNSAGMFGAMEQPTILREIKKLHQRLGATIVYLTDDQIEAMTMATKVAPMKDDMVQQLVDPETIYDTRVSVYVARVVGSPAIYVIPGRLSQTDSGPVLELTRSDGHEVVLRDLAISPAQLQASAGKGVLIGIRPETFHTAPANDNAAIEIEVIEPTGPDYPRVLLSGRTRGCRPTTAAQHRLGMSGSSDGEYAEGRPVRPKY